MSRFVALLLAAAMMSAPLAGLAIPERASASSNSASTSTESVPQYTVRTDFGGEPEFLFEISERFLGDGDRFNEIFVLNEGRLQADGSALVDPAVLNPGWVLQLPPDASGEGIEMGPLPVAAAPEAAPAEPSSESSSPSVVLIVGLIVVMAAGAAATYIVVTRRRRARAAPVERVVSTDRSASWTVDSSLKILIAACDREGLPFPGLYLVTIDATSIHVLLSSPSAGAPAGWTASAEGRTWTAPLALLQLEQVPAGSNERFSGLATLGTTSTGRVLLDFHHARGLVSVEGDTGALPDVIEGWLSELVSNPWSGSPLILRLSSKRTDGEESIDSFIAREDRPNDGIAVMPSLSRAQGEALRALYSDPDFRWILIVRDSFASASWKFVVRDGLLTSEFLPDIRYDSGSYAGRSPAPVG